jgi:hypothetical protein
LGILYLFLVNSGYFYFSKQYRKLVQITGLLAKLNTTTQPVNFVTTPHRFAQPIFLEENRQEGNFILISNGFYYFFN